MEAVFLKLLNMSITASFMIIAAVLLRVLLKKTPKWISCVLWAFVAVRLILPFSFESVFSLIPGTETVSPNIIYSEKPTINSGIPALNSTVNPVISEALAPESGGAAPLFNITRIASAFWLAGLVIMLCYALISYIILYRRVRPSLKLRENIYLCDGIASPFILGIIKPRIYLPSGISDGQASFVIAHEKAHLKRYDHLWKPLAFLLLSVYWFNPLCWAAYILFCKDIELACDERAVKNYDLDGRKMYSEALLSCSVNRRALTVSPLAFGEVSVKERVKTVLNYKKPAFWAVIAAVAVCIITAACLLTDPIKDKNKNQINGFETASTFDGLEWNVESVDENLTFTVKWKNKSDREITYGEDFWLERLSEKRDGRKEWEVLDADKALAFNDVGYILRSGEEASQEYKAGNFYDLDNSGKYRLLADFSVEGDLDTKYIAWVEFTVEEREAAAVSLSSYYSIDEKVFTCGALSWTGPDAGTFCISDDMILSEKNINSGHFEGIGKLSEIELTRENFDKLLNTSPIWSDGYSAANLRRNNEKAWCVDYDEFTEEGSEPLHIRRYLLLQKNGEVFLTYGYSDDTVHIRWIYKMKAAVNDGGREVLKITDRAEKENISTDTALEKFWSDGVYDYFFGSIRNEYVIVEFSDGTKKTVKEAFDDGEISISDLDKFKIGYIKQNTAFQGNSLDSAVSAAVKKHYKSELPTGLLSAESHIILETVSGTPKVNQKNSSISVYLITLYEEFNSGGERVSASLSPAVLTFSVSEKGEYVLTDFWEPEDGENYEKSIRDKFPKEAAEKAINLNGVREELEKANQIQVKNFAPN